MKYSDSLSAGANMNLGFPLDDFLGNRRGSASPIGTASASNMPSTGTHRWIALAVLVVVGYALWHYSQTH